MDGRKTYRAWDAQECGQKPVSPRQVLPEDDLVFFLLDLVAEDANRLKMRLGATDQRKLGVCPRIHLYPEDTSADFGVEAIVGLGAHRSP